MCPYLISIVVYHPTHRRRISSGAARVWIKMCLLTYTLPTHAGVGHQWTESTSTSCNRWLSLAKIALKVPPAGRNRSMADSTNKCGEGIIGGASIAQLDMDEGWGCQLKLDEYSAGLIIHWSYLCASCHWYIGVDEIWWAISVTFFIHSEVL